MYDITNLSDAALDVFLSVKAGEDCVTVEHLTPAERLAVCAALETPMTVRTISWCSGPSENVKSGPTFIASDIEGMILDRQDKETE